MSRLDEKAFKRRIQDIEELLRTLETIADPTVQAGAVELVQTLMEVHGAGLERIIELVKQAGEPGQTIIDRLAHDPVVSSLLLVHGLHPDDLQTRVQRALERVRPYLHSHGGDVQLLGITDGRVRLRLQGSCHGCASSATTLKLAIEDAIYEAAPDVMELQVEGVIESFSPSGFVPLDKLRSKAEPV